MSGLITVPSLWYVTRHFTLTCTVPFQSTQEYNQVLTNCKSISNLTRICSGQTRGSAILLITMHSTLYCQYGLLWPMLRSHFPSVRTSLRLLSIGITFSTPSYILGIYVSNDKFTLTCSYQRLNNILSQ